jgi:hypothetical protein
MLHDRWARTRLWAVRAVVIVLLAAAALTTGSSRVSAGTNGWSTTTAVLPGGTLTINETVPNVNIASSTPIATCPVQGLGTDFITYLCDIAGNGIPAGTPLLQTWSNPQGVPLPGPFSETVTYSNAGPLNGGQQGPTPCALAPLPPGDLSNMGAPYAEWSCQINPLPIRYPATLTVYVLTDATDDESPLLVGYSGPQGSCYLDDSASTPTLVQFLANVVAEGLSGPTLTATGYPGEIVGGHQWGKELKAVFDCADPNDRIYSDGTNEYDVVTPVGMPPEIAQVVSYPNPPAPTKQTIFGLNPPALTSINPASGPPGTTIALTGTDLKGFAISFGATGGSVAAGRPQGSSVAFSTSGSPPPNQAGNVVCNDSGTSCTATVPAAPAGAGTTANVTLTDTWGTSNALTFAYSAAAAVASPTPGSATQTGGAPQLTSIDPASGPGGTTVTLMGTNLKATGGASVAFGQKPATDVKCSDTGTSCTAKVPSGGAGERADVTLTTSAGASNALKFTYSTAPAPSPTAGH